MLGFSADPGDLCFEDPVGFRLCGDMGISRDLLLPYGRQAGGFCPCPVRLGLNPLQPVRKGLSCVSPHPPNFGAVAVLSRGELGGQRPLGIGTRPGQRGGRRLSGLRLGGCLCVRSASARARASSAVDV